ncbi:unnamed protein product, partial [Mesorhabditis belari]|uniref:Protein HGH1 homolog n=1 Tax=Mesorhabditis belari TaxID=2138241 RepID=A0AAF3F5Y5_9BILA
MSAENDDFRDLITFLEPTTRLDVRRTALTYILEASAKLDGSAGTLYMREDKLLGKALLKLASSTMSDKNQCYAALTNFTSGSPEAADHVLQHKELVVDAWNACIKRLPYAEYASRLLANLSRHFPDRVYSLLNENADKFVPKIIEWLNASEESNVATFLGYVLVNLATLAPIRKDLIEKPELIPPIRSVLTLSEDERKREIAADILRNLCFDDGLHEQLLDENDQFLITLLTPLADAGDNLDDDEMEKLPLSLQYFEGSREKSLHIRQKIIESLYQLCSTRRGRTTLRKKGVYPLLRELDQATSEKADPNAPPPKMKPPTLLAQEEHTLHALIGILIREEEDLCISSDVHSLKDLR